MYRSLVLLSSKRMTSSYDTVFWAQRWKNNQMLNAIKNNNPNVIITQCDTLEKINNLQKLVKKQKEKILKNLLENMKKEY